MNYIGMHEYIITDNLVLFTPYNQLYINNLIFFNKDTENEFYILGLTENIKVCPDTDNFSELNNDENYALQFYNYVENSFYTNLFDKIDKISPENKEKILDELNDDEITNSVNEIVSDDENKLMDGDNPGDLDKKIKTTIDGILNRILGIEIFPIPPEPDTSLSSVSSESLPTSSENEKNETSLSSVASETFPTSSENDDTSSIGSGSDLSPLLSGTSYTNTDIPPPLTLPESKSEKNPTGGSKLHKRTFKKILRNNKKRRTIKHKNH
jgi:hypothetical protein